MKRLDLDNSDNQKLIEKLKHGTGLKVNNVSKEGTIQAIYVSDSGKNFFINASYQAPKPITGKTPGGAQIVQDVFISAYFDDYFDKVLKIIDQRVQLAFTITSAKFTPIVGSNMFGILDTPNGYMMTYGIDQSINNNSPIEFKKVSGVEVAVLTYETSGYYFSTLVDKKGNIVGPIYNSITDDYKETNNSAFKMSDFESGFNLIARNECEFKKAEVEKRQTELLGKIYALAPNQQ